MRQLDIDMLDPSYMEVLGLAVSESFIETILANSKGEPSLSDHDTKLVALHLKLALEKQLKINQTLISRITELEKKMDRPWYMFWKK
jgi:hypothetical protein